MVRLVVQEEDHLDEWISFRAKQAQKNSADRWVARHRPAEVKDLLHYDDEGDGEDQLEEEASDALSSRRNRQSLGQRHNLSTEIVDCERKGWLAGFRYGDPDTEAAFLKRLYGDRLPALMLSAGIIPASISLVLLVPVAKDVFYGILGVCGLVLLCIIGLLACLMIPSFSREHRARANEFFVFIIVTSCMGIYGYATKSGMVACADNIRSSYGAQDPYYMCYRTVNAPLHLLQLTIMPIAPRISMTLCAYLAGLIMLIVGVIVTDSHHDKPGVSHDVMLIAFGVLESAGAVAFCLSRESLVRDHFEADVKKQLTMIEVNRRTKEVDGVIDKLMPTSALERLLADEEVLDRGTGTVIFADIAGFTVWCRQRKPKEVVVMLTTVVSSIDKAAEALGVTKIKTLGDCYWAVAGIPDFCSDHASRCIELASAIHRMLDRCAVDHSEWGKLQMRIGIHTDHVMGAILGQSALAYELYGVASIVAQELEEACPDGHTMISATVARHIRKQVSKLLLGEEEVIMTSIGPISAFTLSHVHGFELEVEQVDMQRSPRRRILALGSMIPIYEQPVDDQLNRWRQGKNRLMGEFRHRFKLGAHPVLDLNWNAVFSRRFSLFVQVFNERYTEGLYARFAGKTSFGECCIALCFLFSYLALCSVFQMLISQGFHHYLPLLVALLVGSCGAIVLLQKTLHAGELNLYVIAGFFTVTFPLVQLAGALSPGTILTWQSPHFVTFSAVATFSGLSSVASAQIVTFLCFFVWISAAILGRLVMSDALYLVGLIIFLISGYSRERYKRKQFVSSHITDHSLQQAESEVQSLEKLMSHVLPNFVLPHLHEQLRRPPNDRDLIAFELDNVVVLFVKFHWGATSRRAKRTTDLNNKEEVELGEEEMESFNEELHEGAWSVPYEEDSEYVRVCGSLSSAVDALLPTQNVDTNEHHPYRDLMKVKTMSDTIMVAGGLDPQRKITTTDAPQLCCQLLRFALALRYVASQMLSEDNMVSTMGMHFGPVTAGIIGRQQLIYDVFGNTVNVASRVMTRSPIGDISCSEDFAKELAMEDLPVQVGSPVPVEARGLVDLHICQITPIF